MRETKMPPGGGSDSKLTRSFLPAARGIVWGVALLALTGVQRVPPAPGQSEPGSQLAPAAVAAQPAPAAGNALGGRLWTHIDRVRGGREKFRMYQFNPAGSDGKGTGWYHEGDFAEWMTETLRYEIHGHELRLFFDLAHERASIRFQVRKGRGPDGEDLVLALTPDPRRYWKPYEYFAHSKSRAALASNPELAPLLNPALQVD